MKFDDCLNCRNEVLRYAVAVNIFQMLFKASLSILTGSAALMADAFHSMADIVATFVSMISLKISSKPPDKMHAYGHGKIQFISSAIVGLILIGGSIWILRSAMVSIMRGNFEPPGAMALMGAIISIMLNEAMFRYQRCVATDSTARPSWPTPGTIVRTPFLPWRF